MILMIYTRWPNTTYFVAVVVNNSALTTSTRSNPGHLVPCGSEHEGTHDFVLPTINYKFNKRHFVVRSLFSYV